MGAVDDSCQDPLLFDGDPNTPEFEPTPVYRGNRLGELNCPPPPVGAAPACDFDDYVSQISSRGNSYAVPEGLVQGYVDEPHCLIVEGWAARLTAGGIFKLDGIQPDDALHRLGLRNGDIPMWIGQGGQKHSLATAAGAMAAVSILADASDLELAVNRDGNSVQLRYHIE